jgi:CBS domain-containing protein
VFNAPVKDVMDQGKLLTAEPEVTVLEASKMMAAKNTGAVLVTRDQQLIGIFTERDAVFRVIANDRDPRSTHLADVMTVSPMTVEPDRTFGQAMLLMHRNGFRHLPVIDNGRPIGIVSARNALDPELEEFVAEARRREQFREGG